MRESIVFGDKSGRRTFLRELERLLNEGRAEEALSIALERRSDPRIDDGFPFPDPRSVISNARLRGYLPDDQNFHRERFLPFLKANPHASAIGFDLSNPSHFEDEPGEQGWLDPVIETVTYLDSGYPFATVTREDVLADWPSQGKCPWQGAHDDASASISVEGLGGLYGARNRLARRTPAEEDLYAIESAIAAIAMFMVIRRTVLTYGTPGNRAVVLGSHDDFPYFRALVATSKEVAAAPATDWMAFDRKEQDDVERDRLRRDAKRGGKRERDADLLKELDQLGDVGALLGDVLKSGLKVNPVKAIRSAGPFALLAGLVALGAARKKH